MIKKPGFPPLQKGFTKAGIVIHIEPTDNLLEPFDITLYLKKPSGDNIPDPDDENSFTSTGKLKFKFGRKGSIELFAENTSRIDKDESTQEEE